MKELDLCTQGQVWERPSKTLEGKGSKTNGKRSILTFLSRTKPLLEPHGPQGMLNSLSWRVRASQAHPTFSPISPTRFPTCTYNPITPNLPPSCSHPALPPLSNCTSLSLAGPLPPQHVAPGKSSQT